MKIHIACDHAAFELKEAVVADLKTKGYTVVDHGAAKYDPQDDYPTTCIPCAEAVRDDEGSLGIVLGGSGNGEQIAANLVTGIRCALAWSEETARLARQHNNAQMVSLGARMHTVEAALEIIAAFLNEPFSGDPRHQRRIEQLTSYDLARSVSE